MATLKKTSKSGSSSASADRRIPGNGPGRIPAGSDYSIVTSSRPWTIALLHADTGCGKTTFVADYCPEPVHIINLDGRARPVVAKARAKGREVLLAHIPCPVGAKKIERAKAKETCQIAVDGIIRNFEISLGEAEKGNCQTIAIDTGTELSEILNLSITGQFDSVKGDYGQSKDKVNLVWRNLFRDARRTNVHVVVLARTKEVWDSGKPTGIWIPRGPSVMEEGADWVAQIRKKTRKRDGKKVVEFQVVMTNPKLDMSQLLEVYTEDEWGELGPFVYAAMLQGVDIAL